MKNKEITDGLMQLGYQTGWVVSGDEIALWELDTPQPTQKELTEAAALWSQTEADKQAKAETDKVTAQSKLAALGLTADDLKALGL
jgi:hypothetical protein